MHRAAAVLLAISFCVTAGADELHRSRWLVADGKISPQLVRDANSWFRAREAFIKAQSARFPSPRLPVVYHLDEDFLSAARARRSIEVVDDCGADLCGVADDELPGAWEVADMRAMFSSPSDPPETREARAVALLGRFEGEPLEAWVGDIRRAGLSESTDRRVVVPLMAAKMGGNVAPSSPSRRGPTGESALHGATFSVRNRPEQHIIANGSLQELARLKALGFDAISLIPFGGQRGYGGTDIRRYDASPFSETDLSMALGAARAHRLGMRVLLKPHVWTEGAGGGDPTRIEPEGGRWDLWFASYERFLIHHALLARAIGAEWLAIGTELKRTESRPEWLPLIAKVRAVYHGRITYAANFDSFETVPFWGRLDAVGVDAYFSLSAKEDATDAELRAGAAAVVQRLGLVSRRAGRPVILTELGYTSRRAPWIEAWNERRTSASGAADQARAFEAMLGAAARSKAVQGFFIWKYESDPAHRDELGFLPKEKPAEEVIKRFLKP
ncbi:MAG TPA: hypothetical protein VJ276_15070 [Thermoanaerobaculia bacterium]|nr:hypothetical protein [Thermoanaerobaculia bacterium]